MNNTSLHSATQRRQALFTCLAQIPIGYVASYGQLARMAGLGNAARWVGRTLAQLPPQTQLPWHRVVAADGRISLDLNSASGQLQHQRLIAEGVGFRGARVDMQRHCWHP